MGASGQLSPELSARVGALARGLGPALFEELARASDWIADDLATRLGMVAWEREEQIGLAQRGLLALDAHRFPRARRRPGQPVRVRELRAQPLAALELAWRALRRGRQVHVETEADASPAVLRLFEGMQDRFESKLGEAVLHLSKPGVFDHPRSDWLRAGPWPGLERVALVQADADLELAAYLLARACLRRTGFDPRVIHRVLTVGPAGALERNLRRLWVGVKMGGVDDEQAFAGPVDERRAAAYLDAEARWRAHPGVRTVCPGARLLRPDPGVYLAPALFALEASAEAEASAASLAELPEMHGPMVVLIPVVGEGAQARAEGLLDALAPPGHGRVRFGGKVRGAQLSIDESQVHGALLVERLPPGLPEPRP